MIKRTLQEINNEIQSHKESIKTLEEEVRDFQAACPHPEPFQKVVMKSTDDEYGRIDGHSTTTTCLLCNHSTFEWEDANRRHI